MKRLISLTALLVCSLTLCGAVAHAQTWRLTNDAYSDSLPKITINNAGRIWVVWLSNSNGNYDVYFNRFNGASWTGKLAVHEDAVDQNCCQIANDPHSGFICVAWDSAGKIQRDRYASDWEGIVNVVDSNHLLQPYNVNSFFFVCDDSGNTHVSWSSNITDFVKSTFLRSCIDTVWDTVQTVLSGDDEYGGMLHTLDQEARGIAVHGSDAPVILNQSHDWSMGGRFAEGVEFASKMVDSRWVPHGVAAWNNYAYPSVWLRQYSLDINFTDQGKLLVVYVDTIFNDSLALKCKRYSTDAFPWDTTFIIKSHVTPQSGTLSNGMHPTLAWSDSHSVFLNTYYDTMWSHPPVRISDTSLHNCINPDIVAENDSTVWVCYQNDGDIYVTRTSVPLGVSGKPMDQIPNPQSKISLMSWPNPASNVIHFSYNLPNKRNSSVSIYDIAGRLVKVLEVKNDQINWNCADNTGRRVASGVYFARLNSGGQETIQRISIIK